MRVHTHGRAGPTPQQYATWGRYETAGEERTDACYQEASTPQEEQPSPIRRCPVEGIDADLGAHLSGAAGGTRVEGYQAGDHPADEVAAGRSGLEG